MYRSGAGKPALNLGDVSDLYYDTTNSILYVKSDAATWIDIGQAGVVAAAAALAVSDVAYDATTWNAVTDVAPSKNAVRDQVETMLSSISAKRASAFTPTTAGDWPTQPTTIQEALDKLADRLNVLEP